MGRINFTNKRRLFLSASKITKCNIHIVSITLCEITAGQLNRYPFFSIGSSKNYGNSSFIAGSLFLCQNLQPRYSRNFQKNLFLPIFFKTSRNKFYFKYCKINLRMAWIYNLEEVRFTEIESVNLKSAADISATLL